MASSFARTASGRSATRTDAATPLRLVDDDDRNLSARLLLVLPEDRIFRLLRTPDPFAFLAGRDSRSGRVAIRPDLDGHVWVRDQIVKPVGIRRCASLRGEHRHRVADPLIRERIHALRAGLRSDVVNEKQWHSLEHASDLAVIRP